MDVISIIFSSMDARSLRRIEWNKRRAPPVVTEDATPAPLGTVAQAEAMALLQAERDQLVSFVNRSKAHRESENEYVVVLQARVDELEAEVEALFEKLRGSRGDRLALMRRVQVLEQDTSDVRTRLIGALEQRQRVASRLLTGDVAVLTVVELQRMVARGESARDRLEEIAAMPAGQETLVDDKCMICFVAVPAAAAAASAVWNCDCVAAGSRMCGDCLERLTADSAPCPFCRKEPRTV